MFTVNRLTRVPRLTITPSFGRNFYFLRNRKWFRMEYTWRTACVMQMVAGLLGLKNEKVPTACVLRYLFESAKGARDRQEEVQWHNVYAWGKTAETCCAHLSKGALLFVEGEVRQIQTSKKSENSSPMTIVHAHQIRFLKTNKGRTLDNFGPARNHDAVAHR